MENDQKPNMQYLSCILTERHNFKIMLFFLYGYHTSQLKSNDVPAIAFLSYNFKVLPNCHMGFLCFSNSKKKGS